jgi:hypothetical protein
MHTTHPDSESQTANCQSRTCACDSRIGRQRQRQGLNLQVSPVPSSKLQRQQKSLSELLGIEGASHRRSALHPTLPFPSPETELLYNSTCIDAWHVLSCLGSPPKEVKSLWPMLQLKHRLPIFSGRLLLGPLPPAVSGPSEVLMELSIYWRTEPGKGKCDISTPKSHRRRIKNKK